MFDAVPYTILHADVESRPSVYLYGLSFCDHCAQGRKMLEDLEIPFGVTYVDRLAPELRRPVLQALREAFGRSVLYPVLEIDGNYTFGYNKAIWSVLLQLPSQKS